jgi:hypothetical protein
MTAWRTCARMHHRSSHVRIGGRKSIQQSRCVNRDRTAGQSQHPRERNPRQHEGLLCLNQPRLSSRSFRVAPRRFRPRPKLIVDKRVDGSRQKIPAVDVRLQSRQGSLSARDR